MQKGKAFAIVPTKLLDDPTLDAAEKMTLIALLSYANPEGRCWPSLERIAQRAGISRRGTMKILKRLDDRSLIERTRRTEPQSKEPASTVYAIGREYRSLGSEPDSLQVGNQEARGREPRSLEHIIKRTIPIEQRCDRKPYGEHGNVHLTDQEYGKLITQWGEQQTSRLISTLADYKLSSGRRYKNDAAAIRNWVIGKVRPVPLPPVPATLPRAETEITCPKCSAQVPKGEIACPECDFLVADMKGGGHESK